MQRTLFVALAYLIVMMSVINASPMPTAAPRIRRQDSGAQTTAPYTTTYDPSQGINGNGCQQGSNGNTLTCCPDGYQNQSNDGVQSCVKLGGSSGGSSGSDSGNDAPVGNGNGQDNGNDSGNANDGNNQTLTGIETGVTTYTSDGAIIVSHGISIENTFSSHQGASTSTSTSSSSSSRPTSGSGSNGGSIVHVPVSLVLAVIGAVVIGAF